MTDVLEVISADGSIASGEGYLMGLHISPQVEYLQPLLSMITTKPQAPRSLRRLLLPHHH